MTLDRLAQALELLPAGAAVTLPRETLLEALAGTSGRPSAMPSDGLLTVANIAAQLHRSPSTVRGWCEAGRFVGAFKLNGKDWRIPAAALDAFLNGQRPNPSREDAVGSTIVTRADTRAHPRRPRKGQVANLGAWRQGGDLATEKR